MAFRNNNPVFRLCNTNNNHGYQSSQNQGIVCRFDLRGYCRYGRYCKFTHITPNDSAGNNSGTEHFTGNRPVSVNRSRSNGVMNPINSKAHQQPVVAGHENIAIPTMPPNSFASSGVLTINSQPCDKKTKDDSSLAGATCSNWERDESVKFTSDSPKRSSIGSSSTNERSINGYHKFHQTGAMSSNSKANFDMSKDDKYLEDCITKMKQFDIERSLAIERSKDKLCGICMDTIVEKSPISLRTFGILPNCYHVFCLSCIRTWRQENQFEKKIIKACPECRIRSDFIIPSKYWVDKEEAKVKLIEDYKKQLSSKPCKFFKEGKGYCTFDNKCFYLHAYPDGRIAERQLNRPRLKRRARKDSDEFVEAVQALLLAELMEECDLFDYLDLSFHSDIFDSSSDESFFEFMFD